jgi:rubredoxin
MDNLSDWNLLLVKNAFDQAQPCTAQNQGSAHEEDIELSMVCPKCGFENDLDRQDCMRCGVIFGKISGQEIPAGHLHSQAVAAKSATRFRDLLFSCPEYPLHHRKGGGSSGDDRVGWQIDFRRDREQRRGGKLAASGQSAVS